ncbi:MAG TPA: anaerobic glycerol-3-phosphate dehydrogenase subunit C, partial [Armatimonadota bacterium]|nr:anaerobic glycerol-3-phosphate dehydrogenase subunit C [Armatimonadota bacterium]
LECKACKSECPSNVDMAKMKYEFLAHYHAKHGTPLRARVFGHAAALGRIGTTLAPLSNWLQELPPSRWLLERALGIDRRRPLPRFAAQTFERWWRDHRPEPRAGTRGEVLFLADTFTNFHEPEIGQAAVRVLEAFGYRVEVPALRCCGRPMISKGLLREARENARYNVSVLEVAVGRGVPVVGMEPSCVVTYKDEYADFGLGDVAREVGSNTWLLEDFLAVHHGEETDLPYRHSPRDVRLHGHCHQKAVLGTTRALQALRMVPGYRVAEIASGCCGMAGSFGYEKEHYEVSQQVGELSLFPAVRSLPADTLLVAAGTSCRQQVRDATGREALHPVQALARALDEEPA